MKFKKISKLIGRILLIILIIGLLLPSKLMIPVKAASKSDWDKESFWYYPWGKSITHKGIDIFSLKGNDIIAPVTGIVLSAKTTNNGGNVIYFMGPKWRIYYFAHLDTFFVSTGKIVAKGTTIGKVGCTGNAQNKSTHLHFSIITPIPYFWLYDRRLPQGALRMFYLNPDNYFKDERK